MPELIRAGKNNDGQLVVFASSPLEIGAIMNGSCYPGTCKILDRGLCRKMTIRGTAQINIPVTDISNAVIEDVIGEAACEPTDSASTSNQEPLSDYKP